MKIFNCHHIYIYIFIYISIHICHRRSHHRTNGKGHHQTFTKEIKNTRKKRICPPLWWNWSKCRGAGSRTRINGKTNFIYCSVICNLQQLYKNCRDLFIYIIAYFTCHLLYPLYPFFLPNKWIFTIVVETLTLTLTKVIYQFYTLK